MIKINSIRILAYVLALVIFCVLCLYASESVENAFDTADTIARVIAQHVSAMFGTDRNWTEAVIVDRVHTERSLVFFPIALVCFIILLYISGEEIGVNAMRLFVLFLIAHVIIAFGWIGMTETTKAWYGMNYQWGATGLRSSGYGYLVTPLLRFGQFHSLLVTIELVLMLSLIASLFSRWWRNTNS